MAEFNWSDFLEQRPEAGYAGWLTRSADTSQNYWPAMQRQYNNWWSRYLGRTAQDIMEGRQPTLSWMNYLGEQNPRNVFRGLSSYDRGVESWAPLFRFIGRS